MSPLAVIRMPGVWRTLGLSLVARLPAAAIGLLVLLQVRELGLSYAIGGLATAAFALGIAAGSPLMGRLVDRHGQPRVLHLSGAVAAATLVAIAAAPPGLAPVLVACCALCGLTQPPIAACVRAIWTRSLTGRPRDAAFALDSSLQEVAYILGPLLLVSAVAQTGPGVALVVTGVLLAASTSAFAFAPEARATRAAAVARPRTSGNVLASPAVRTLVLLSLTLGFAFGAIEIGIVAFAEERHVEALLGILYGSWSVGAIAAGVAWARRRGGGDPVRHAHLLLLALAASSVLLAALPSAWWLAAGLVPAGAATAPLFAILYRLMADAAPHGAVTEAYAWETTGLAGGIALGSAAAGVAASLLGLATIFVVAGATVLAAAGVLALRTATLRAALAVAEPGRADAIALAPVPRGP